MSLDIKLAGGLGLEPRLAESESAVLPLDDPPTAGLQGVQTFAFLCNSKKACLAPVHPLAA
jgi:hypothetical protein